MSEVQHKDIHKPTTRTCMSGRTMRTIVCDELMAWMDVAAGLVEGQKWTARWTLVSMCAERQRKRHVFEKTNRRSHVFSIRLHGSCVMPFPPTSHHRLTFSTITPPPA